MGKKKYTLEFKRQVVLHYINSGDGAKNTARQFGIDHGTVRRWTEHWKISGDAGFLITTKCYSAKFKESVIRYMWDNSLSSRKVAAKFKIAGACTVSRWERLYRQSGIIALQDKRKGRPKLPAKKVTQPRNIIKEPQPFSSPQEELEYLRAENVYLKKLHALIREKQKTKQK